MSRKHPYYGKRAALATIHNKETIMAPILERWLGVHLLRADHVDTDSLGTFTGEIPRIGTMLETARKKAKEAVRDSGCSIGLGSEGSFGPDPDMPFLASGSEIVLLYDASADHEIFIHKRTRTNYDHISLHPNQDPSNFLTRIGFPAHAVVIKPESGTDQNEMIKGINDVSSLHNYIQYMASRSTTGRAIIQTDMRAHLNPTRMKSIGFITKLLALRARRLCPECGLPGFGQVDVRRGLPCADCTAPTSLTLAVTYACHACSYRLDRHVRPPSYRADPRYCSYCNP